MNILVTGGAGYIGRHACRALKAGGFHSFTYDARHGDDVLDPFRLNAKIDLYRPQAILHLAAHSDVAESMRDPVKYRQNVLGTAILADAAGNLPIVFASSAAVYGEGGPGRLTETAPLRPVNPYGASKVDCEALLPGAISLRFFNVAGGDGDEGAHLIPKALKALAGVERFELTGDGTCVRDFIHVADVAQACVLALKAALGGKRGETLNICSGLGLSVREVLTACERITGRSLNAQPRAQREGDPAKLVGDNARAFDVLGWAPTRGVADMIRSAWAAAKEGALVGAR